MYSVLNPFPIQFLALFAYLIVRVCVGCVLLYLARKHWSNRHELQSVFSETKLRLLQVPVILLIALETVLGILFIIGAYTQYAALGLLALSLCICLFYKHLRHDTIPPRVFYCLLIGISLSLFITGAGALAVDLPI
jgi:uncharacterized membrane protein YphA (DoxX/SURF4 family)